MIIVRVSKVSDIDHGGSIGLYKGFDKYIGGRKVSINAQESKGVDLMTYD